VKFKEKDLIISLLFAILMLTIINLYILLIIFPAQARLYSSAGMTLPFLTILCLSISNFFLKWMFILVPFIAIIFITQAALALILKNKATLVKIYSITACGLLVFTLLSVYAIKAPLIKLDKALRSIKVPAEVEKSNNVK
jgi:type II secretory pathway component PulF